jgi:hypothetical protein
MADSERDLENSIEMRGEEVGHPRVPLAAGEDTTARKYKRQQEEVLVLLRDEEHPK